MEHIEGKLISLEGPMFCSKSSTLVQDANRYADLGFKTLYINSAKDTRNFGHVSTHSSGGLSLSSKVDYLSLNSLNYSELETYIDINKYKVIFIDEFQFFSNPTDIINEWVDISNKIVHVGGLDLDAKRRKWGSITDLIADSRKKLTAICKDCLIDGRYTEAPFTSKINPNGKDIEIGGADLYIPVCRGHWNKRNY